MLTEATLLHAVDHLTQTDPDSRRLSPALARRPSGRVNRLPYPRPDDPRTAGVARSARAAYDRLAAATGEITPASVLQLDDATLRTSASAAKRRLIPATWPLPSPKAASTRMPGEPWMMTTCAVR